MVGLGIIHGPGKCVQFRKRFGPVDGLLSTECGLGLPNLAVTSDAKLWAATPQGLAMLDLARLLRNNRKPAIYMEQIAVGRTLAASRP